MKADIWTNGGNVTNTAEDRAKSHWGQLRNGWERNIWMISTDENGSKGIPRKQKSTSKHIEKRWQMGKDSRTKQVKWKILKKAKLVKENEYKYEFVTNRNLAIK